MKVKNHVFISYAHLDNENPDPGEGWVTRFEKRFTPMLTMRLGERAEIWRDKKLEGSDIFSDEILDQFQETAVLASILSPRYVESEWCAKEVRAFCEAAEESGGVRVANKSRLIKLILLPPGDHDMLPEIMRETLGHPFFVFQDGAPMELDPLYGEHLGQQLNKKIAKLAFEVAGLIKMMEEGPAPAAVPGTHDKPTVYLASCSWEQRGDREALETDLKLAGYTVLPDRNLPREEEDFITEVGEMLTRADLSIHLVGETYGGVPAGPTQKSEIILENEQAIRRSESHGMQRIIWLPEGTESGDVQQQSFIRRLQEDAHAQFGADLVTADIETVKRVSHTMLSKLEEMEESSAATPDAGGAAGGTPMIYLICDERDRKATIPLRKYLKGNGFDVKLPVFEGDSASVRTANNERLTRCRAAVLFYGAGDEAWRAAVESDLRKAKSLRSDDPLPAPYTVLSEPMTDDKTDLIDLEEPNLIDVSEGFEEEACGRFLSSLLKNQAHGG